MPKPQSILSGDALNKGALKRRDFIKLGLTGAALSCLNSGCENKTPTNPPDQPEQVYELTDGRTLYDDFDGSGNLQTYDNQNLAEDGKLNSKLWDTSHGTEVVQNPAVSGLLTVINEDGQRVEYGLEEERSQEIEYVFDADGKLIQAVPHTPGQPYHGSKKLLWVGTRNGRFDTENGPLIVEKGTIYRSARVVPTGGSGWVLRLTSSLPGLMGCFLAHPRDIAFADFRTLSADMMVPSTSTARSFYAALDYHTTIPEQPPGKSWFTDLGIHKYTNGELYLFAQCRNMNAGNGSYLQLGQARSDIWYNLRQNIVTTREDPTLGDNELRIEYFVNGILRATEIPEDSELLLDPERTGWGPNRLLIIYVEKADGDSVAYFDNIKAVYRNRLA
jgi:hypothetical protein